jgi:hypothetical protein
MILKLIPVLTSVIMWTSVSASESSEYCASTINGVRLTTGNILFVGNSDRRSLDEVAYRRYFTNHQGSSTEELLAYLKVQTEYRIIETEEIIAVLDSLVPSDKSLFWILKSFSKLRFDEIEFSENFLKPSLTAEAEQKMIFGKNKPLPKQEELLLTFAKRLHEISLVALGERRTLLATPKFFADEVTRLDAFLESLIQKLGPPKYAMDRIFRRSWSSYPVIREALFGLGFLWSHPVAYYQPNKNRLPLSISERQQYSRRLFYHMGPLTTLHWVRTHMMWAAFASFVVMIPNQFIRAGVDYQNFKKIYGVLENTDEGQKILNANYQKNLRKLYVDQIKNWETELQLEKSKLQSDPNNSEIANKVKLLEEQIAYYREKLKPN